MVTLNIKVKPGSFKDEVLVDAEDNLIVKIREKPIEGAANEYLVKYLAKEFKLSKGSVILEKGTTSKFKRINLAIEANEWNKILSAYKK